jgi:hypothetical protein
VVANRYDESYVGRFNGADEEDYTCASSLADRAVHEISV